MSVQDFGIKNATAIRQPATANLMIDSDDRNKAVWSSPFNFTLQENQSIMNGFFTRIATTEAVVEWCNNNINGETLNNSTIPITISTATYDNTQTINIPKGNYTVSTVLESIKDQLNLVSTTTGVGFNIVQGLNLDTYLQSVPPAQLLTITGSKLAQQLDADFTTFSANGEIQIAGPCADLRPYRYMDIVSESLGYCQKLKDNSTNGKPRNVLLRWYFSEDAPEPTDGLDYPILQGYLPFRRRRIYNPPKQLRWDPTQPVGQIVMRVYDENGDLVKDTGYFDSNYLLTLQLSEN